MESLVSQVADFFTASAHFDEDRTKMFSVIYYWVLILDFSCSPMQL